MANVISYLLDMMRVRGTAYVGKKLDGHWSMAVQEHPELARFHLVLAGEAWIELPETGRRERLTKGQFAIIPNGRSHIVSDNGTNTESGQGVPKEFIPRAGTEPEFQNLGNAGTATHLVCGYFQLSENTPPTIRSRLPAILVLDPNSDVEEENAELIIQLIQRELSHATAPASVVLNRLTEILCIYSVHRWLRQVLEEDVEIGALSDPRLHVVLDEIHADPSRNWTVEGLASIYGQSRTAFAVQFKSAIGMGPVNYVTQWRIRRARKMLTESHLTIDDVAEKAGYGDTNAFSRAFKRETGTAPAEFRRMSRS